MVLAFSMEAFADGAGNAACATCHRAESPTQPATAMAHAMRTPDQCDVLQSHSLLTFRKGQFTYRIETHGATTTYSVSDGNSTFSAPVQWALGLGEAGQTYVFEKDGSALREPRKLLPRDRWTGSYSRFSEPASLKYRSGGGTRDGEARCCTMPELPLHRRRAWLEDRFCGDNSGHSMRTLHPGAGEHATSFSGGKPGLQMERLGAKTTERRSDFCGQCHRTWQEIALSGKLGISNVRFQPYRLANSKCYSANDARIRCTACHDPHGELNRVAANYDGKCEACHSVAGGHRVCAVAKANCASCHMPKLEIPGSHFRFTDHEIRIVKANEKYPD